MDRESLLKYIHQARTGQLTAEPLTFVDIAVRFNRKGIPRPSGSGKWTDDAVRHVYSQAIEANL